MRFSIRRKRTAIATLVVVMTWGLAIGHVSAGATGTLPAGQDSVEWALTAGVARGFGGDFRPDGVTTRQAFMAFIARVDQLPPSSPRQTFSDVPADHPFFEEIEAAAAAGVARGFGDGTFRPDSPLSRQAAVAFLSRLTTLPPSPPGVQTFSDVPAHHPFFEEIEAAAAAGVARGFGDGTFRPSSSASRQAAAMFVHRTSIFDGSEMWASEPLHFRAVSVDRDGQVEDLLDQEIYLSFLGQRFGISSGQGCVSEGGIYSTVGGALEVELVPPDEMLLVLCEPKPGIDLSWLSELIASSPSIDADGDQLVLASGEEIVHFQMEHIDWDDLGLILPE